MKASTTIDENVGRPNRRPASIVALVAIGLWVVTIAVGALVFYKGFTTKGSDQRTAIVLSVAEKDQVLSEMRLLLGALQGSLAGLAAGDPKRAATAARTGGMGMAVDEAPALIGKLPASFKQMGMAMHKSFDDLASALSSGEKTETILERMAGLTGQCVACHQLYRLHAEAGP